MAVDKRNKNIQKDCCSTNPHPGDAHQQKENHHEEHSQDGHSHGEGQSSFSQHLNLIFAFLILVILLILQYVFGIRLSVPVSFCINLAAYFLAGWSVVKLAFRKARRGDFFNEFVLMTVATTGAFALGEYAEGVAVMVFYSIGEWFQDEAVGKAKRSLKALLDVRPDVVTVSRDGVLRAVHPSTVKVGENIHVKPGEKVALDGNLTSQSASFNTAALTGESKPDTRYAGEAVLAGMVNLTNVAKLNVTSLFRDSKLSRILEMVQDATARKSQTQLFISRFAKVYTPIVFFLALALVVVPYFFVSSYEFHIWFYRALVFLVISCPCALVVSIPLGYFGGIGLASRHGILFKGGNFLDAITKADTVVMDKTGTLTKGVFKVQEVIASGIGEQELIRLLAALEQNSTHPVGKAVMEFAGSFGSMPAVTEVEEIAGQGLRGHVAGKDVLAGNGKLLEKYQIEYPNKIKELSATAILVAIDGKYAGYVAIADEIKEDAVRAVELLRQLKLKIVMLSGDKQSVVDAVALQLGISEAFGDLLPEDKVEKVQKLKTEGRRIVFAGDGINDAPVVALADVGIAMGGLGSDATIETADVVIQNDQPSKIVAAIKAGRITRTVVWQNIVMAMVVKLAVLLLGAGGIASLWEAVIADVGVAFLAILNAVRIQRMRLK